MANLVVSGYNFGLPNKHSFILAQWNTKNIQDYAKRCNADCKMINCNSFMDKFKILSYLNTYDKVLWMDMDLIIHMDRFPNLFEYDDNRTYVCDFDVDNGYKNEYLKSFCNDPVILSKTTNVAAGLMLFNKSFLKYIDDDVVNIIKTQTELHGNDEAVLTYINRKFDNVFYNFNHGHELCRFMIKFDQILHTPYIDAQSLHFVVDFKKHNNDPLVCKFINGFILKNIHTAFNNDNIADIDANLLLWKDIQSLQK